MTTSKPTSKTAAPKSRKPREDLSEYAAKGKTAAVPERSRRSKPSPFTDAVASLVKTMGAGHVSSHALRVEAPQDKHGAIARQIRRANPARETVRVNVSGDETGLTYWVTRKGGTD